MAHLLKYQRKIRLEVSTRALAHHCSSILDLWVLLKPMFKMIGPPPICFDVVVFMVPAVTGVGIHRHNACAQEILSHTSDYNSSVS